MLTSAVSTARLTTHIALLFSQLSRLAHIMHHCSCCFIHSFKGLAPQGVIKPGRPGLQPYSSSVCSPFPHPAHPKRSGSLPLYLDAAHSACTWPQLHWHYIWHGQDSTDMWRWLLPCGLGGGQHRQPGHQERSMHPLCLARVSAWGWCEDSQRNSPDNILRIHHRVGGQRHL